MLITKETIYKNLLPLLKRIFRLPGVTRRCIKGNMIFSPLDIDAIRKGVEASYHDILSDIDLFVFLSSPEKIMWNSLPEQLGLTSETLLGISREQGEGCCQTLRVIRKDGMRYDIIFCPDENAHTAVSTEGETADVNAAEIGSDVQNSNERESSGGTDSSEDKAPERFWSYWDLTKADSFWFIAVQALGKLYRGDYLIADHLTNMLINETLVAQMIERDNQYGTNIHRYGHQEELEYQKAPAESSVQAPGQADGNDRSDTFLFIADKLFKTAAAYDRLILRLNPAYEARRAIFYELWSTYDRGITKINKGGKCRDYHTDL